MSHTLRLPHHSALLLALAALALLFASACASPAPITPSSPLPPSPTLHLPLSPSPLLTPSPNLQPSNLPPATADATADADATFNPPPSPTPPPALSPSLSLCSPLQSVPFANLPVMITNPFHPPPPGSDDPHQGVDFSDLLPGTGIAQEGAVVQAILSGEVALVVGGRFPYGNAVMIETPLESAPASWIETLALPTPAPTLPATGPLTCPADAAPAVPDSEARSLYVLYAHMQSPPELALDEAITCGQALGAIGSSGNALNPHLHVETRVGPAGARFEGMAHYDASATPQEMSSYCTWRVSGLFQLLDPLRLLGLEPLPTQ